MSGWIHRRHYPDAESVLADTRLAARLTGTTLYAIRMKVPEDFRKYWPDKYYWRISEQPPFHGKIGNDYYPMPDYYIIEPGALLEEIFITTGKEV